MTGTATVNGPLALVLSGGGARAAYQVGVLDAIAEQRRDVDIPILTGVSAGALNSMYLAAHRGPFAVAVRGLRREWARLTPSQVFAIKPPELGRAVGRWVSRLVARRVMPRVIVRGLLDVSPLRGFIATLMDVNGVQRNLDAGRLRAVGLSATRYSTGETVTFIEGAGDVPLWTRHMRVAVRTRLTVEHLMASAAIPLFFPAVRIGDAFYGDGSVRQTAPLAPAIHLGAGRILAISMRAGALARSQLQADQHYPVVAEVVGLLMHSVFLDSLDADAERLARMNELIAALPDPARPPSGMRRIALLLLRPSRDLATLAGRNVAQLPRSVQFLLRTMGSEQSRSSDLLSYLMFEPEFIGALMELGYEDTRARWGEIDRFLS